MINLEVSDYVDEIKYDISDVSCLSILLERIVCFNRNRYKTKAEYSVATGDYFLIIYCIAISKQK